MSRSSVIFILFLSFVIYQGGALVSQSDIDLVSQFRKKLGDDTSLFRGATPQIIGERFSDAHLLRWIQYADNDLTKAERLFRRASLWFSINRPERTLEYTPSDKICKALPFEYTGTNKEGLPVYYWPLGRWDLRKAASGGFSAHRNTFKYMHLILEKSYKSTYGRIDGFGNPIGQVVYIVDLDSLNFRQLLSLRAWRVLVRTGWTYARYYPYLVEKFYVVKAPRLFPFVFSVIKNLMNPKIARTIEVYGRTESQWKAGLHSALSKEVIPNMLGGTKVTEFQY